MYAPDLAPDDNKNSIKKIQMLCGELHDSPRSYFDEQESYKEKIKELNENHEKDKLRLKIRRMSDLIEGMKNCSEAKKVIPIEYIEELESFIYEGTQK